MASAKRIFALGFFDGVHLGHQALLRECVTLAEKMGVQTAAITFEAHPKSLFSDPTPLISTIQDRKRLLRHFGMDHVHVFPVTWDFLTKPWEQFLQELLDCGAAGFVCGDDFRFGHFGAGNAEKLQQFCAQRNLPCIIVPEQTIDGIRISSSYIRKQLEEGDMATAVRFLGHPYELTGTVIHGHRIGRTLGIPTANLLLPDGLVIPRFGVYICRVLIGEKSYPAVTNIGTRPTVSGSGITVEPWILDFEGDLYDREITLQFFRFLRPETKFPDLASLQQEIRSNAVQTRSYFEENL